MTPTECERLLAHGRKGAGVDDRAMRTQFAATRVRFVPSMGPEALVRSGPSGYRAELDVSQPEQPVIHQGSDEGAQIGERAARSSLRAQVARLERELSAIVAAGFPYISAPSPAHRAVRGPCLLSLEELERSRDELAGRVQEFRRLAAARVEHERRAHELLAAMKLEPGRYKFVRLAVNDLGQGGCGVWEVRPRLGLIGMLAGWWQVKLSSGCPLPRGSRSMRGPEARTRRYTPLRPRSLDPRRARSPQHPTRHLSGSRI